jgi:hypothetical protein
MLGVDCVLVAPYVAWLRVYEPLAAFPEPERAYWTAYTADPKRPSRLELLVAEQASAVRRAIAVPPIVGPDAELGGAFVLAPDAPDAPGDSGETGAAGPFVCPLDERLRSWLALEALRQEVPEPLMSAFVPSAVAEAALSAYADWRIGHPGRQPRILTATWHVPLWWFVAFTPEERHLTLAPAHDRALLYRTTMGRARQRMARALSVLRRSMGEGVVTDGVEQVSRWLEEFHPHSRLELDYGGLASLVDDETLESDASAADVAAGLAALAAGEADGAAAAYSRLLERWQGVQALEHAT